MPGYTAMDYATASCESIKGALDAVGTAAISVPMAPYGDALVIQRPESIFEPGNAVVIFMSADSSAPSTATIVAGVAHSIDADANRLLQLCNGFNQVAPVTSVAFQGDTGIDVLLKIALPPRILVDVPPYAQAVISDVAVRVPDARAILDSNGIHGTPHQSNETDVERILTQVYTALI